MKTAMTMHHQWVKHTVTPVSLLPDPDNDNEVFLIEDPQDIQLAEDQAVYGCHRCGLPMSGNTDTLCEGDPDE